jgi:hypothetical protein
MRTHRIAMHPMTRCVERDWMNIHPPLAARHNLYAQRAPVRLYAVAETTQGRHTVVQVVRVYGQVQVPMGSGYGPDQRVDAPPSCHPVTHSRAA